MNQKDKELFEKYLDLYESYKKHQFIRNYSKEVYADLIYLYMTYVNEKHNFSHWCSSCRTELVMHLYNWYSANVPTTWYKEVAKQEVEPEVVPVEEPKVEVFEPPRRTRKKKQ